jgi:ribosomal protein S12 methylthiotransferase
MAQRFSKELPGEMPEVDAFIGLDQLTQIVPIIESLLERDAEAAPENFVTPQPRFIPDFDTPRFRLTPAHTAYVKIAEGCNHPCSFCIIPQMRGRLASRPIEDVLREAERLANAGVKELLVISQDTSAYGADLRYAPGSWRGTRYETRFIDLARGLSELSVWIRLHYVYPYPHVDQVLPLMAQGKVLPYLDIPFQHGSPSVLKRMRRPAHAEDTLARIRAWRRVCPTLTLRSTFIVGFPGETEAEFEQLLEWLDEAQLDRVGCFKYSPVEGATANALGAHVAPEVQEDRYARFMERAARISAARLGQRVGERTRVLVDAVTPKSATARSAGEAPDIDGVVRIESGSRRAKLRVGEWAEVEITGHDTYDLTGRLID